MGSHDYPSPMKEFSPGVITVPIWSNGTVVFGFPNYCILVFEILFSRRISTEVVTGLSHD